MTRPADTRLLTHLTRRALDHLELPVWVSLGRHAIIRYTDNETSEELFLTSRGPLALEIETLMMLGRPVVWTVAIFTSLEDCLAFIDSDDAVDLERGGILGFDCASLLYTEPIYLQKQDRRLGLSAGWKREAELMWPQFRSCSVERSPRPITADDADKFELMFALLADLAEIDLDPLAPEEVLSVRLSEEGEWILEYQAPQEDGPASFEELLRNLEFRERIPMVETTWRIVLDSTRFDEAAGDDDVIDVEGDVGDDPNFILVEVPGSRFLTHVVREVSGHPDPLATVAAQVAERLVRPRTVVLPSALARGDVIEDLRQVGCAVEVSDEPLDLGPGFTRSLERCISRRMLRVALGEMAHAVASEEVDAAHREVARVLRALVVALRDGEKGATAFRLLRWISIVYPAFLTRHSPELVAAALLVTVLEGGHAGSVTRRVRFVRRFAPDLDPSRLESSLDQLYHILPTASPWILHSPRELLANASLWTLHLPGDRTRDLRECSDFDLAFAAAFLLVPTIPSEGLVFRLMTMVPFDITVQLPDGEAESHLPYRSGMTYTVTDVATDGTFVAIGPDGRMTIVDPAHARLDFDETLQQELAATVTRNAGELEPLVRTTGEGAMRVHGCLSPVEALLELPRAFTLRATIAGQKPPIWRRVEIDAFTSCEWFHAVIQGLFGWGDTEPYEFVAGGIHVGGLSDADFTFSPAHAEIIDLVNGVGESMDYRYGSREPWGVELVVENVLVGREIDEGWILLDAAHASPPDRSRGIAMSHAERAGTDGDTTAQTHVAKGDVAKVDLEAIRADVRARLAEQQAEGEEELPF